MSNFSIRGVYSYNSSYFYTYLGRMNINSQKLDETFRKFNLTPTGSPDDLRKLDNKMYEVYSEQVKGQMANQNADKVVPWAALCAQIGVQVTGDFGKDKAAFDNAIQLLSQSALDGSSQAQISMLKSEAQRVFNQNNPEGRKQTPINFQTFKSQFLT